MSKRVLAIALLTAISNTGCASIFSSGPSPVEVTVANAPDDHVHVEFKSSTGQDDRVTDNLRTLNARLRRDATYTLSVSAPGYATRTVPLSRSLNPWLTADLLPALVGGMCFYGAATSQPIRVYPVGGTPGTGAPDFDYSPAPGFIIMGVICLLGTAGELGIDFATSSAWSQSPSQVHVVLDKQAEK